MRRRNRRSDRPTLNATVVVVSSQMGQRLSFLKKRIRGPFWTRRQKENAAQWDGRTKGTWLRGFARIVAAVDGGIGLTSFDEEGEEGREGKGREGKGGHRQPGLASRNDDDDDGEGRKAEQKTANELTRSYDDHSLRNSMQVWLKSIPSLASDSPRKISPTLHEISLPLATTLS